MSNRRFVRTVVDGVDVYWDLTEIPTTTKYYRHGPSGSKQLVQGNARTDTAAMLDRGSFSSSGGGGDIFFLIEDFSASQTDIEIGDSVTFTCRTSSPSLTSKVMFYQDGNFLGTSVSPPYQITKQFSSNDSGPVQIDAVAYDFSDPPVSLRMSLLISVGLSSGPDIDADPLTRGYQPDIAFIAFEQALLIDDAWVIANKPLIKNDGITVVLNSRNFKSNGYSWTNNNTINALHIKTKDYVIEFHNCIFAGYGTGGTANGIVGGTGSQRVKFYGCKFYGLIPTVRNFWRGRGLQFNGIAEIVVRNCDFYSTCGIAINGWSGGGRNLPNTIDIQFNRFFEIDGRIADPDQGPLYPGGPSGFFIGNTWGGDTASRKKIWGSGGGVGATGTVSGVQSTLMTSIKFIGSHSGGTIGLQILRRGQVIATLSLSSGVHEITQTFTEPVWLDAEENLTIKVSSAASGATYKEVNVELFGLPSVGLLTANAVGNTGLSRVKYNRELLANESTTATRTMLVCDSHTGGEIRFEIIDRDVLANTERVIGTSVLAAGSLTASVSMTLPEILRTGHQLKLKVTQVASGASCTNVRVGFYSRLQHSFVIANLCQMNNVQNIPNAIIAHNLVKNTPNQNRCEDLVSLYKGRGLPTSPILVDNNLFLGGSEVYDPWFNPNDPNHKSFGDNMPSDWPERWDYRGYRSSGGQGLLGDGRGATDLLDPAFCVMRRMTVVATTNYSIGISGGHDMTIEDSTVVRSGYMYGLSRDVVIAWGHVGVQIQDYNTGSNLSNSVDWDGGVGAKYALGRTNSSGQTTGPRWYGHRVRRIRGNYIKRSASTGAIISQCVVADDIVRKNSPLLENYGHILIPNLTRNQEMDEITSHIARWRTSGYFIGS